MPDSCSSFTALEQDYNLPLHIGALFIILFVSGTACAFPLLVVKIPQLRIPSTFLFFVRHFGTGVLLATAFVHLLPTAFTSLTDPCLPAFWNQRFPAMAGAIAMAAVFVIVVIEMVFSPGRSMCGSFPTGLDHEHGVSSAQTDVEAPRLGSCKNPDCDDSLKTDEIAPIGEFAMRRASHSHRNEKHHHLGAATSAATEYDEKSGHNLEQQEHAAQIDLHSSASSRASSLSEAQKFKRETLQCVLLEMGILFHSIFIGMALSVAVGNDFVVLLIAITFHQTFEGLALGSRIAAVSFPKNTYQPWFMALAYGCTTPIGQAIGLAMHSAYDPQSATGLIMVGVMNAISSGLLTYASLVELIAEDFLSDHSWNTLRGKRRVIACVLVFAGAFCMALVGAWA